MCLSQFSSFQIVKNQIHRYKSTSPIEYEKESDPTLELGDDSDNQSTKITLAIVLTAFFISPMTECLGPVLELNVTFLFFNRSSARYYVFVSHSRVYWQQYRWHIFYPGWHILKWNHIRYLVERNFQLLVWSYLEQLWHWWGVVCSYQVLPVIANQTLFSITAKIMGPKSYVETKNRFS